MNPTPKLNLSSEQSAIIQAYLQTYITQTINIDFDNTQMVDKALMHAHLSGRYRALMEVLGHDARLDQELAAATEAAKEAASQQLPAIEGF